ncbi:MAG: prepilin peptidase [Stackebrandtia sp.]
MVSAATAGLVAWRLGYGTSWWAFVAFASLAPSLAVIDASVRRLPFWLTIPAGAVGVGCLTAMTFTDHTGLHVLLRATVAAVAVGLTFLLLAVLTADGMGGGDVVLAAVIGFYLSWLGWNNLTIGLMAGLLAAAVGAGLTVLATRSPKTPIPLGPFLLAGWLVGVLIS